MAAPRIGIFNLFSRMLGIGDPVDIYTHIGMVFVIGIYLAPYVMMIVASALRSMDPSLEEAGQVSGMSVARTAMTVTLPVVAPAILSSAILTFVITIGLFGTPVLLGWSKQILLITSRIYLEWLDVPPAYGVIAVLSIYLVVLSGAAMLLQNWLLKGRSFVTVTGKGYRPRILRLGKARFAAAGAIWLYLALAVFAPLAVIVIAAMVTYTWSGIFTWTNLLFLWTSNDVAETLKNSLIITVLAATITTTFGIFLAWVTCRTTLRGRHLLEVLVLLPASVPGIAFGIGVVFFWLRVPIGVYGTVWIIVLAFLGRYASYAVRTISSSLVQVHPELEESARICGYGWLKTLSRITLPLVRPSIVSSWILLYSIFITELSMVTILHTTETRTFSILTFNTWFNGRFTHVASLSLLQLVLGVAVMFAVRAGARKIGPGE
jgi:iron(III) transport system permease protein